MLRAGDRVAYVKGHPTLYNSEFFGKTGTVRAVLDAGTVQMEWDGTRLGYYPTHCVDNIRLIEQPIDETESFFV